MLCSLCVMTQPMQHRGTAERTSHSLQTAENFTRTMATKRLNFSLFERNILLRLLEENIDIVESKRNDGLTVRRKDETWARIVSRFNADPNVTKRTPRQLRKCWNNLKMRAKKLKSVGAGGAGAGGSNTNFTSHFELSLPSRGTDTSSTTVAAVHPISAFRTSRAPIVRHTHSNHGHQRYIQAESSATATSSHQVRKPENLPPPPEETTITPQIIAVSSLRQPASTDDQPPAEPGRADECGALILEASSDNDETPVYHHQRHHQEIVVNSPEDDDEEGYDDVHILETDTDEKDELHHRDVVTDKNYNHETAVDSQEVDLNNTEWTTMDCARSEHEAKMALLTIQMETAREQRELAREQREQTRQRHRLEIQLLEEKRRYRRVKMSTLSSHGQ